MTTLYRSPNLILDAHEWHALVRKKGGRVSLVYYFRPLSLRAFRWMPITSWKGPKPKGMCNRFWPYRSHIRKAMESEALRAAGVARLKGPPTAAAVRNVGVPEPLQLEKVAA